MKAKAIIYISLISVFILLSVNSAFSVSIFTVAGTVTNNDESLAISGLEILVNNETRNLTSNDTLGKQEIGKYGIVFIDTDNKPIADVGDVLKITVKDNNQVFIIVTYELTADDIANARAIIDIKLPSAKPSVFTVAGTVKNVDGTLATSGLEVNVVNETKNLSAKDILGKQEAGKYGVVFIDTNNKVVADEGDVLKITVKNANQILADLSYKLTANDIANSVANVDIKLGQITPVNQSPIASFTFSPNNPLINTEITFDASSSYDPDGQIASYEWDFGDGSKGKDKIVKHTYTSEKQYTVSLKIADNEGKSNTTSVQVTVGKITDTPDLAIKSIDFQQETTDILIIQALIINTGKIKTTDVQVQFFDNGTSLGSVTTNAPIGVESQVTVKWKLNERITENHRISAKIISSNPPEQNTTNNEISKAVSVYYVDSGRKSDPFRVNEDGYSFENWGMTYGEIKDDFINWCKGQSLFGQALRVMTLANPVMIKGLLLQGGVCNGMSATSIRYRDYPDFKPVNKETYAMKKTDPGVVGNIRLYFSMYGYPIGLELAWTRYIRHFDNYNISEEYNKAFDFIVKENKPVMLILDYKDGSGPQHSIAGYSILDLDDEKRIYVYDNNYPGDYNRFVRYNLGQKKAGFDGYDVVLSRYPIVIQDELKKIVDDLWNDFIKSLKEKGKNIFILGSPAYMTVTDNLGRKVGFVDGKAVNDIPGASVDEFGGAQIIYVPDNLTCKIETTGTDTGNMNVDIVTSGLKEDVKVISYEDVPVSLGSKTLIDFDINNPKFGMSLDKNADGIAEEIISPNSIVNADKILIAEDHPWDVNSDGVIDDQDMSIVIKHFGESQPSDPKADVNKDGNVNILDLVLISQHFGEKYK